MKKTLLFFFITLLSTFIFFNQVKELKIKVKTSGAKTALDLWNFKRAYPFLDISPDKHFKAFLLTKELDKNEATDLLTQWMPIGPHNIGGRTLSVEFNTQNTNTIFAGAASGGLWRSYTGGVGALAWEYVETGFPVLGVSSIAISPNDSNLIYIGTGEEYGYKNSNGGLVIRTTRGSYGIGILKTTDYGITWQKSLDWSYNQERGVNAVVIDPTNVSTIWAATSEGTYKSTDAGTSWELKHNVIMAMDVDVHPNNSNIVYAACGDLSSTGNGIYRTTDGGNTWVKLTSGLPSSYGGKALLSIHKANPQIIYASIGNGSATGAGTWLCKTTNGGDSWTTVSTVDYATYQGWYSHFAGVHPTNPNFVVCGGIDVWKSTNSGSSLNQKSYWYNWYFGTVPPGGPEGPDDYVHADLHSITYHPTNPNIIYFGTDGGVFRTLDGAETFAGCNGGYQSTQFYGGFSSSPVSPTLAIGGMQDNATAIYKGTVAWYRVIGGDGCQTAMHTLDTNIMYGTYQYLALQRSNDYGQSWNSVQPPNMSNAAFAAPVLLAPSQPNVLFAGADKIYKSTNNGSTWTALNGNQVLDGNPILAIAVSYFSTDTLYLTTAPINSAAKVFRSVNAGVTWQNITNGLPDRYPDDIVVDPNNTSTVYIAYSGFGSSHLFKSTDAGSNWVDIGTSLPDVPGSAVIVDPYNSNYVFYGNDVGFYYSIDAGNSWQEFNSGLPSGTMVYDLSISKSNRKLRLVTHGNGIYEAAIESIVPVELTSFTGVFENKKVLLQWSTAVETNNRGFEIERKFHDGQWNTIGFAEGKGTSTISHSYSFIDNLANFKFSGTIFYRLKQYDFNGNYKYSNEIEVTADVNPVSFTLYQNYPNPFNPITTISFYLPIETEAAVSIFSPSGEKVVEKNYGKLKSGTHQFIFNAENYNLTSGVYIYRLKTSEVTLTKKLVLIK